jgi:hypothetical protein
MNSSTPPGSASPFRNAVNSASRANTRLWDRIPLLWKAVGISLACAVIAFLYFLFTGSLESRSVAEIGPAAEAKTMAPTTTPKQAKSETQTPVVVPPEHHVQQLSEFILSPSSEFQHIGPVSIRLKAAHPELKTCDLVLRISKGHEWNQTGRINKPVPLVKGKRSTQLVITEIAPNSVKAYISVVPTTVPTSPQ